MESIADTGCDVIGIDWLTDISESRERVGNRAAIQGNLDPEILLKSNELEVIEETKKVIDGFGSGDGHIFNLGHGILPATPVENVKAMIKTVKEYSPKFHKSLSKSASYNLLSAQIM